MRKINVTEDIIPIGELKTHASELLRKMHANRRPLVITQNGRPAAVVMAPEELEELGYREFVKAKIRAGLASAKKGASMPASEVRKHLKAKVRAAAREG